LLCTVSTVIKLAFAFVVRSCAMLMKCHESAVSSVKTTAAKHYKTVSIVSSVVIRDAAKKSGKKHIYSFIRCAEPES